MKVLLSESKLKTLISEGRLEDLITKYSSTLPEVWIKELSSKDPSGNNKYLEWMVKETIRLEASLDDIEADVEKVVEATLCFHENVNRLNQKSVTEALEIDGLTPEIEKILKSPKDINVYSVDTIEKLCEFFEKSVPKSSSRIKIYEDSRYLVVSPLTHKASCQYGAHSNWCVSTSNEDHFQRYSSEGILFFIIDKEGVNPKKPKANSYKFAIYSEFNKLNSPYEWQFFDMEDDPINPILILNLIPKSIIEKIYEYTLNKFKELQKKFKINKRELEKNSILTFEYNEDDNIKGYVVFIDYSNPKMVNYFSEKFGIKLEGGDSAQKVPFIKIETSRVVPKIYETYFTFSNVFNEIRKGLGSTSNGKIPKSLAKPYFLENFFDDPDIKLIESSLNDSDVNLIFDMAVDNFNSYNITGNETSVTASQLKVGDVIEYKLQRWPYTASKVKVIRVSEKSVFLSNAKRIPKNSPRTFKLIGSGIVYKIVDDTETGIKTESRWLRKGFIRK